MIFKVFLLIFISLSIFSQEIKFSPNSKVRYINTHPIEIHSDLTIYSGKNKKLMESICKGHKGKINNSYCAIDNKDSKSYVVVQDGPKKLKKISIINSRSSLTENEINKAVE